MESARFNCTRIILSFFLFLLIGSVLSAQVSTSSGAIFGTITDQSGAVVPNAKVVLSNKATGFHRDLLTNDSGQFNSGSLTPGAYILNVDATGFDKYESTITVSVGVVSNGDVHLGITTRQTVEVTTSQVQVDTAQATVQGILDRKQIEEMPINGRNFLDLAQLQPGVQIQDGATFDPTKTGFSSISFGGRYGRTARVEVDGIDISDETVGTTTENLSEDAIDQFQIAQSSLDLSTSLTSSGSVNVTTRGGTNEFHGSGFYYFRDHRVGGAAIGGVDAYAQRNNYGGSFGGPLIKNKLFFFTNAERMKQDSFSIVPVPGPLSAPSGGYSSPFRNGELLGRMDWLITPSVKAFYRFTYNKVNGVSANGVNFSPFFSRNNTPGHAGGIDFSSGNFTHSFRAGYSKMINYISDAVGGLGTFDPAPGVTLSIGSFGSGPNQLVPQKTIQSNIQFKYDGSWIHGSHIFRYGSGINRIRGGGFAAFNGLAPVVSAFLDQSSTNSANLGPFAGGSANPLNYLVGSSNGSITTGITLGNGQGFGTELPQFGYPAGGQRDIRFTAYVGDTWKLRKNLTMTYGLRYVRDTGRSDADLPATPLLDEVQPGLGRRVNQPNNGFGPQLGLAWDPKGNGKTVIRAGAGIYYENNVWNNQTDSRSARLPTGLFAGSTQLCPSGTLQLPDGSTVTSSDGLDIATQICGQPIGNVYHAIADLQKTYQAVTISAGPASNGSYVGNSLAEGIASTGITPFSPDYKTPLSYQMNIGIQREIRPGLIVTADYLRNVNIHTLLGLDYNHAGDARYLDVTAAQNAIANTLSACGVATIDAAIAACPGLHPASMGNPAGPATIQDFAANGLDSPVQGNSGSPNQGFYAFGGKNPKFGEMVFLSPVGRSVYNALQLSARQHKENPLRGFHDLDLTAAYSLSRFVATATDGDYGLPAADYNNPEKFIGPSSLDRKHQFSVGLSVSTWKNLRISTIAHFYSPLPLTLTLPTQGAGDIFIDDVTGDGTGGDVLPGTKVGSFMRDFGPGGLNAVLNQYNTKYGGQFTPAGQALIASGLMTAAQLRSLGGVMPIFGASDGSNTTFLSLAPQGQVGMDWLRTWDVSLSYPLKIREGITLEMNVSAFNLLNFANFDSPGSTLNGSLQGGVGFINGTTYADQGTLRTGLGSGTYAFGAPRQLEFGLRLKF